MKEILTLLLVAVLFSCSNSAEKKAFAIQETKMNPEVALKVINDYVASCNEMKDADEWVRNNEWLTEDFKKEYHKIMQEAREADPELGLGFDPIFNAQDYPEKGFQMISLQKSNDSMVTLKGIDMDISVKVRLKEINGKWLVDGMGAVRN
jgi:hypothetical protein